MNEIQSMIENDIKKLDKVSNESMNIMKNVVIDKLKNVVEKISIDPNNEKPSMLESKTMIINSLVNAIVNYEKSLRDTLKVKSKIQSDQEIQKDVSNIVTSFLKELSNNNLTPETSKKEISLENLDTELENKIKEKKIVINHDEISLEDQLKNESNIDNILDKYSSEYEKENDDKKGDDI